MHDEYFIANSIKTEVRCAPVIVASSIYEKTTSPPNLCDALASLSLPPKSLPDSLAGAMIFYDEYSDVPIQALQQFVTEQQLGRLVTVSPSGQPHIGLYPFHFLGSTIEMHLNRQDEQLADLRANPKCAFALPTHCNGRWITKIPSDFPHAAVNRF